MILDYIYIYIRHQLRKWSSWKCTNHPCWHSRLHHNSKCMINMRCIQNQACRWKFDYKTWFSWYQSHQLYQYPKILYPIYNDRLKIGNCKYVTSFSPIVKKTIWFFTWISATNRYGPKTKSIRNHVQASSPRFRHHGKVCFTLHMQISNIAEWNVMCKLNDSPEQNMVWVCCWTRIPSTNTIRSLVRLWLPMHRECTMYTYAQYETWFERTQLEVLCEHDTCTYLL